MSLPARHRRRSHAVTVASTTLSPERVLASMTRGLAVGVVAAVGYCTVVVIAAGLPIRALGFAILLGAAAGAAMGAAMPVLRHAARSRQLDETPADLGGRSKAQS